MSEMVVAKGAGRPSRGVQTQRVICLLPVGLCVRLRQLAEDERRPLTMQIQILLERALEQEAEAAA